MRISVAVIAGLLLACTQKPAPAPAADPAPAPAARPAPLLGPAIQLTLDGGRAGEGYFSADGTQLIFQSERQDDNPFYQIYRMDLTSGDVLRLSPGHGKTTCAWLHPDGQRFLFASTHEDPDARKKQKDELEFRASGKTRRYSWDYDPTFEIYVGDTTRPGDPAAMVNVTRAPGYDAEGSFSPDGTLIAFASNRRAYTEELSDKDAKRLKTDPSFFIDLYVMNADGSDLRRITESDGYDGGPFFSPDGSRITWRRFNEKGTEAEIWTANVDGTDAKQLTQLGAMSWAPYYHPSGD
ncbi:MAG: peptidase M28, partial [Myxococcota bacterium]